MFAQEITSFRHPLIKQYIRLSGSRRHRRQAGKVPLEGPNLIEEALRAGLIPEAIFYTRRYLEDPGRPGLFLNVPGETKHYIITSQLFKRIALTDSPQEVAALAPLPPPPSRKAAPGPVKLGLLLDRLQDLGNLGTIIRTAAASAGHIYCTAGTVDPYSPKVMRSTVGAVFHRPPQLIAYPRRWLDGLKTKGVQIVTTGPGRGRPYWEVDYGPPTIFIIGNESRGVDPKLASRADRQVSIPQPGWENSLNAAVSAALLLYEALRQRS